MENPEKIIQKYDKLLNTLEDETIAKLNEVLNKAYLKLEIEILTKMPKYLKSNRNLPTVRASLMIQELGDFLSLSDPTMEDNLKELLEKVYQMGQEYGADLSQLQNPNPEDYSLLNTKPYIEAAAFAAKNAYGRLKNHSEEFRAKASALISLNLSLGISSQKTAVELRKQFNITKFKAETIARTETIAALNEAAVFFYKENDIDYIQLFATADTDTCSFCLGRNQWIYEIDAIKVPLHPRCRCYLTPVRLEWLDEKFKEWSKNYRQKAAKDNYINGSAKAPFESTPAIPRIKL